MTKREFLDGCQALLDGYVARVKRDLLVVAEQLVNVPPDGVPRRPPARSACSAAAPRTSKRRRAAARPASPSAARASGVRDSRSSAAAAARAATSPPTTQGPREAVAADSARAAGAVTIAHPPERSVAAPAATLSDASSRAEVVRVEQPARGTVRHAAPIRRAVPRSFVLERLPDPFDNACRDPLCRNPAVHQPGRDCERGRVRVARQDAHHDVDVESPEVALDQEAASC